MIYLVRSTFKTPGATRFQWLSRNGSWVEDRLDAHTYTADEANAKIRDLRAVTHIHGERYGFIKVPLS